MHIVTDVTDSNFQTGDFTMPHHVTFTRPGTTVTGDSAHGNSNQDHVIVVGHVVLHDSGEAPEGKAAGAPSGGGPSTLTCDQLEIDAKKKIYIATGNVQFSQGPRHGSADYGKLDQGAHALDLRGNVHLAQGESTFSGDAIHYDTLTKDVHSEGNPMEMTQPMVAPPPAKPAPSPKPHR
jgi:lipopolysaccharide export system protein LptA